MKKLDGVSIFFIILAAICLIPLYIVASSLMVNGYPQFLRLMTLVIILAFITLFLLIAGPLRHRTHIQINPKVELITKVILLLFGFKFLTVIYSSNQLEYNSFMDEGNYVNVMEYLTEPFIYKDHTKGGDSMHFKIKGYPDIDFHIPFAEWVEKNYPIKTTGGDDLVKFRVTREFYDKYLIQTTPLSLWEKMNHKTSTEVYSLYHNKEQVITLEEHYYLETLDNKLGNFSLIFFGGLYLSIALLFFRKELNHIAVKYNLPLLAVLVRILNTKKY